MFILFYVVFWGKVLFVINLFFKFIIGYVNVVFIVFFFKVIFVKNFNKFL